MQIGEMLVRAKAITPGDLEEAIGWQVIYGGKLGTNLLELGLVDERVLAEHLGRQQACEWTCGEFELPASIVRTIPASVARRQEIVPWRIEGKRFKVLASTPSENLALFDELGFKLGLIVKPVVAPEYRIHQLLRRYFGSVRQMRALDFGVKPKGKREQDEARKAEEAALEKQVDLMDDEAFAAIYAEAFAGRVGHDTPVEVAPVKPVEQLPPPGWEAPQPTYADASSLLTPIEEEEELPLLEAELIEDTGPQSDEQPPAADRFAAAFADLEARIVDEEARQSSVPGPDLSPLSFQEAVQEIGRAEGREEVARAVLRYARSKAARALLLNVQGDVLTGWAGVADDLDADAVRRIAVPLGSPSVFRLVRESRSHFIGPLGKDPGNVRFLKAAGKKWPATAALMPILFRGKVVYILYTDNGHKQQVNPEVGELLVLAQNITRSMEQLVARKASRT